MPEVILQHLSALRLVPYDHSAAEKHKNRVLAACGARFLPLLPPLLSLSSPLCPDSVKDAVAVKAGEVATPATPLASVLLGIVDEDLSEEMALVQAAHLASYGLRQVQHLGQATLTRDTLRKEASEFGLIRDALLTAHQQGAHCTVHQHAPAAVLRPPYSYVSPPCPTAYPALYPRAQVPSAPTSPQAEQLDQGSEWSEAKAIASVFKNPKNLEQTLQCLPYVDVPGFPIHSLTDTFGTSNPAGADTFYPILYDAPGTGYAQF